MPKAQSIKHYFKDVCKFSRLYVIIFFRYVVPTGAEYLKNKKLSKSKIKYKNKHNVNKTDLRKKKKIKILTITLLGYTRKCSKMNSLEKKIKNLASMV